MSETTAWLCTLGACAGFGSNYVPSKMTDIKDGQFFSFWMGIGIWMVGLIQWLASGCYEFQPIAMLGGVIWATGNCFVPFIIKRCGLGVGCLVWGATNMLTGWATGAFGLFGIDKAHISNPALNYVGVGLAIVALGFFTQMGKKNETKTADSTERLAPEEGREEGTNGAANGGYAMGLVVALFTGVLFGCNFDPPTRLQQIGQADHEHGLDPRYPTDSMPYVFSHFTGILALLSLVFAVYKLTAKECHTGTNVIVPGLVAGVLWGIAQVCWFVANNVLSFVVSFPIIVGVPGVIAAILGIILFGENREPRSLKILAVIIVVQGASLACIALSH